jgi:hypothetical protein
VKWKGALGSMDDDEIVKLVPVFIEGLREPQVRMKLFPLSLKRT